ncbi:MAG TPA: isoprenylcysteine carboxylmethyltransferase family protein [Candidatus Kryptonia bacterium]|nr:isoprenylcysteine carboxylmethyltransferase family protein [Candidatus Kryptonia bacterium]
MLAPSRSTRLRQREVRDGQSATLPSPDIPGVIVLPPLLYGGAFVAGSLLHQLLPQPILPLGVAPSIGVVVLVFGAALAVWSRRTMVDAGTSTNPSQPATALVVSGPFRFSRNPMYAARTLLYLGLALLANALCILATLAPVLVTLHYGVIKREERYLEAKFGDAYRDYRTRVRRWL